MDKERTGIRILLASGVRIPGWVLGSLGVSVGIVELQGREVQAVDVRQGNAGFIGGGAVDLKIGRQKSSRVAFSSGSVLEIRTLDDELVERNHLMCPECVDLTGKMISFLPSKEIAGREDVVFQCERNPEHKWEIKHI